MILDWKQYWKTAHEGIKKHNDKHTTMSTFKAMKFRVESPEHSKQIQEALFELGYGYIQDGHKLLPLHLSFIYTESNGDIRVGDTEVFFQGQRQNETTLEELQEMVALKISAERKKEIEHAGKAIFEQINTLTRSAKRSAEFVDRVAKVMTEPKPPFEKGHDDSTNVTKPNNIDLIKRIETLEKQMAMIHARQTPCILEPKFATGRFVEGLDAPIPHEKHVEFTHRLCGTDGWEQPSDLPKDHERVVYLGECEMDGDMFAAHAFGVIDIFKGKLNSGTY